MGSGCTQIVCRKQVTEGAHPRNQDWKNDHFRYHRSNPKMNHQLTLKESRNRIAVARFQNKMFSKISLQRD